MIRLRRFQLDLFGHFSGKAFDFGDAPQGTPDFHVIYGPNEAGKSTTMEGFLRLLYGFPHRDPYDFMHQRKNMRVSGVLDIDGNARALTRLPVRNGSLLDGNNTALPDATLLAHLGGLNEQDYRQLLCLDDDTIERGGEEIASSKGDIGRLLFSAAAGVSDLTGVLDHTREQADALYRKRASTTELARLKKQLAEVERQIKEHDIPAAAYRKLKQALDAAQAEEGNIKAARDTLRRAYARTQAQAKALPMLAEVDRLSAELAPFAGYPPHLDIDPETLVDMLTRQSQAETKAAQLDQDLTAQAAARDALRLAPEQAGLGDALDDLDDLRSRYTTADLDLPKRRASLTEVQDRMRLIARDLGAVAGVSPQSLCPTSAQLAELAAAQLAQHDCRRQFEAEQAEVEALTLRLGLAQAGLDALLKMHNAPSGVGAVLHRFSVDTLAPQYAAAQQAMQDARTRRDIALDALTLHGQAFDALPPCNLDPEEAAACAARHSARSSKLEQARDLLQSQQQRNETLTAKSQQITTAQGLITDSKAQEQQATRDTLWQQHLDTLDQTTADAFAKAMQAVDASAKQRLTQANDIGVLRNLAEQRAVLKVELNATTNHITQLEQAVDDAARPLTDAAVAAGLPATVAPAIIASWVTKQHSARLAETHLARVTSDHAATLDKAARLVAALGALIPLDTPDFETLIAAARDLHKSEQQSAEQTGHARKSVNEMEEEHARHLTRLENYQQAASAADTVWRDLVAQHFDNALPPEVLEASLDPLRDLRALSEQAGAIRHQITAMQDDQADFTARVSAIATPQGVNADDPVQAHAILRDMARAAQDADRQHKSITAQITEDQATLAKVQADLGAITQEIATLAALFPPEVDCATLPKLRLAVAQARDAIAKRNRLAGLVTDICSCLSSETLAFARDDLHGLNAGDLDAAMAAQQDDLNQIEETLTSAIETRSGARHALNAVTGDADIAALNEQKATLEAQIEDTALRYLELDLGHHLAQEAIRRYRDAHRSTMMDATEQAFADLTNGAYPHLRTQPDGTNEVLLALDSAGMAKQAQDMSKGTRFQLYLALRAAAYEQLATQGICLPFFCDDIFETFDEQRTRSACRLMARIGRRGQAIYLTHHQHVVDIAQDECGDGVVIHTL